MGASGVLPGVRVEHKALIPCRMTARQLGWGRVLPTHLHPGVEDIEECEGVALVTLQGPPCRRTLGVALGGAGEGRLDAEGSGNGEHRLGQVEHGAQDQHLSWGRPTLSLPGARWRSLLLRGPDPPPPYPGASGARGAESHPESAPSVMKDCFHLPVEGP